MNRSVSLFGLALPSSLELVEGVASVVEPDVDVRYEALGPRGARWSHPNASLAQYGLEGFLRVDVRDGRTLVVDAHPDLDPRVLRAVLVGAGVARLWQQRGRLVLHGNAVRMAGQTVWMSGDRGAGKSTLCAALVQRGASLVADDVLVVGPEDQVEPGIPRIKLWPEAVEGLGLQGASLEPLHPMVDKVGWWLPEVVEARGEPLWLLLDPGEERGFELLEGSAALEHALRHVYCGEVSSTEEWAWMFPALAQLVSRVRVARVSIPRGFEALSAHVDWLQARLRTD